MAICLATVAAAGCVAVWAVSLEPNQLVVHQVSVVLPRLPVVDDGMRVAVITDLHAGAPFIDVPKIRTVVDRTNAANPDLTVILGDLVLGHMVGGHFVPPERIARELGRLRAPLGNHDGWVDAPRIAAALRTSGITVLRDRAVERAAS
ncbi:MAG: metallophosphoesterase, partial [Gemmatimonadaceae bacterium]